MLFASMLSLTLMSVVTIDGFTFESQAEADRYSKLIGEFRCPKCLNTSIADSDAPIATDLRRSVYELIQEGKTNREIKDHLQERYGTFILYQPPLKPATLLLWFAPVILLLLAIWCLLGLREKRKEVTLTTDEKLRIKELTNPQ